MKKLVLLLAVVFSVSLFSCGNKAGQTTEAPEVEATEVVEEVVEKACCEGDSACCKGDSACCDAAKVEAEVVEVAGE